ncbi:hypothetical protein DFP72DRAFT_830335 [Ephemerocybe angulata]|uniref:Uncharacterized protein n=1 Tax=Ephemerocybe angulata TaxID=980116 RepID=A0A8H6H8X7_9AGAR|nr:hypothetical protein DFP72DRAFT_830335 [Tulosesus angulatus]
MGDQDLTVIANANTVECSQCTPPVKLDLSQGQRVLEHVGCHILFNTLVTEAVSDPCGLCLRSAQQCKWFVRSVGHGRPMSEIRKATGLVRLFSDFRHISYVYGVAAVSSPASPCSNVPLQCPLCAKADPAVWRYNLHRHLVTVHPTASPADYASLWTISDSETATMKKLWASHQPKAPKRARKSNTPKLVISEAHTSLATDAYIVYFQANRVPPC